MILAAGASSRLGEAKQLAMLHPDTAHGEKLLERAVRVAADAGCAPVVVVLGARAVEIQRACTLGGALVRHNAEWHEGMASSIRVGIAALEEAVAAGLEAAVVMGCDQPAVTADHLRRLIGPEVTASAYAGRRGIPACFPAEVFGELMRLRGDRGARDLLQTARAVELDGGELDVDTPELLAEARARFGRGES